MKAFTKILAGGVAFAALASAAPAAAQYQYGNPSGSGVIGQVIQQVLGGGRYGGYGYNGYGANTQVAAQQCAAAVEQRINGRANGYGGYGGYSGYGYNNGYNNGYSNGYAAQGRVLAVTQASRQSGGMTRIRGYATSGATAGYGAYGGGYGYNGYGNGYATQTADLKFRCDVDYRGYIRNVDVRRNTDSNAYNPYRGY